MAFMAHAVQHAFSVLRGGTSPALAAILAASVLSSCTAEPSERSETTSAGALQEQTESQPDQLPLPEIMRDLERDMAAIGSALWMEDFPAVTAAARRVADHPSTSVEYRQAIQEELGGDFPTFVEYDQKVHFAALLLAERAEASAPISELLELQHAVAQGCIGCHAGFRSRLQPAMDRLRSSQP
jgi:hypothetical protein